MTYDVIIIGGSFAGMAAALQLLRAHRHVLVLDAGQRRNRFTSHAHGLLGQDGVPPDTIAATARAQVMAYPTLTWVKGTAQQIDGTRDAFRVTQDDGQTHLGRRLLLATGVQDSLPDIPGLAERWGRSIFHCPYCHGYELNKGQIGVIASSPMSAHQAEMLAEWGQVTYLLNAQPAPDPDVLATLNAKSVTVERTPIARIGKEAEVRLSDGRALNFAGLFVATTVTPATPLAAQAGCAIDENAMGQVVRTDSAKMTSLPGIYACGDVAVMPHSLSLAIGDGAWAGMQVHRSLVWPDA